MFFFLLFFSLSFKHLIHNITQLYLVRRRKFSGKRSYLLINIHFAGAWKNDVNACREQGKHSHYLFFFAGAHVHVILPGTQRFVCWSISQIDCYLCNLFNPDVDSDNIRIPSLSPRHQEEDESSDEELIFVGAWENEVNVCQEQAKHSYCLFSCWVHTFTPFCWAHNNLLMDKSNLIVICVIFSIQMWIQMMLGTLLSAQTPGRWGTYWSILILLGAWKNEVNACRGTSKAFTLSVFLPGACIHAVLPGTQQFVCRLILK